jgi:hypothetical protein
MDMVTFPQISAKSSSHPPAAALSKTVETWWLVGDPLATQCRDRSSSQRGMHESSLCDLREERFAHAYNDSRHES